MNMLAAFSGLVPLIWDKRHLVGIGYIFLYSVMRFVSIGGGKK